MSAFEISVIIPCYNAGPYVRDAVDSVLAQKGDFTLKEIIIVDDRSDDDETKKVLTDLSNVEPVRLVTNEGPRGPAAARNTGIGIATGNWIAFLDADDLLTDGSIEARCQGARQFPDCGWIGGDFAIMQTDGSRESRSFFRSRTETASLLREAFEENKPILMPRPMGEFIEQGLTNTVSCLTKRELILECRGFDTSLYMQHDYNLFLRLASISDFVFVPHVVMLYRQHGANFTKSEDTVLRWRAKAILRATQLPSYRPYRKLTYRKVSKIWLNVSNRCSEKGDYWGAVRASVAATFYEPAQLATWRRVAGSLIGR